MKYTPLMIGILIGFAMGLAIPHSTAQEQITDGGQWIAIPKEGYFYTTGLTQRAWFDGTEMDLYDFQDQLELDLVDAVLGTATRLQVMNLNATDIRIMETTN